MGRRRVLVVLAAAALHPNHLPCAAPPTCEGLTGNPALPQMMMGLGLTLHC